MNLESAISITLKELRFQSNLSQEKLAHQCDIDRTYISLLERGKRKPTLHMIFKICDKLNILPSEFIKKVEALINQDE
jgi:transcriptional regulator with XRE-family HTH domain